MSGEEEVENQGVENHDEVWWGDCHLAPGETGRFKVGPLTLWIERRSHEWRVGAMNSGDRDDISVSIDCAVPSPELPAEATVERLVSEQGDGRLVVAPALADRLVVTRPEGVFRVLAGASITFYVSTPLWLRVENGRTLFEAAVIRPSDTWFGPTTRHGEMAYASRTTLALDPSDLPRRPFRAITRVELQNRAADDLELKRFALPAPNLALYFDRSHPELGLWTSGVAVERRTDRDLADLAVQTQAPRDLVEPEHITPPRSRHSRTIFSRAMSGMLS